MEDRIALEGTGTLKLADGTLHHYGVPPAGGGGDDGGEDHEGTQPALTGHVYGLDDAFDFDGLDLDDEAGVSM